MEICKTIVLAVAAYFVGSVSFSYILTKKKTGEDIRDIDVKNAGALNVFANIGKFLGVIVGFLDCLKTLLIVVIAKAWGLDTVYTIFAASFGIIGHCFPIYHDFYGGKGASCVVGIFIYFIPVEFLISIIPAALIAYSIHRIGTTPIFFIIFSPIISYLFRKPIPLVYSLAYISILTGVINAVIIISKRDFKEVPG